MLRNTLTLTLAAGVCAALFTTATLAQCPPVTLNGDITAGDPTAPERITRDAVASTCAAPKTCPGPSASSLNLHYDTHSLTNQSSLPQCVSVTMDTSCSGANDIFMIAYLGAFNPADECQNYLADAGFSASVTTMSFTVPAGATFVLVVIEGTADTGCPDYSLTVTGDICAPPPPAVPQDRVSATEKGSVLIFSKVELRWDATGKLKQDTFIDIANDYPADVLVKMYFINGDRPITHPYTGAIIEPGWNWLDNVIELTANEPTFWSCATGMPKGVSPFTALDPGALPGRIDPENPGERHLRGYIIAFAVNENGHEIRWNHLKGDACIVNYAENSAWEYNAWSFAYVGAANHGAPALESAIGVIRFNGVEYAPAYDQLLMDFYAVGSSALSGPANLVTVNTDITLHPLTADVRQETVGPFSTKASFDIWNQNEVKFTGLDRCITCWDQALMTSYGIPNHFLLGHLQTDKGRARIDGIRSTVVCPEAPNLRDEPLLGLSAKHLSFDGSIAARAGGNMHGLGVQTSGAIAFDESRAPGESASGQMGRDTIRKEVNKGAKPRRKR